MRHLIAASLLFLAVSALAQDSGGVPQKLLSRLHTGANVTRWFCYLGNDVAEDHLRNYLTAEDFANFKKLKIGFVRLCISPDLIDKGGEPDTAVLKHVDAALDRFQRAGIAVIWDLHDNGQLKLDQPGHDNSSFVRFWQAIARHYRGKAESQIVFEILNEPIFQHNPDVWYALQRKTVAAIRQIDTDRTILVASTSWNGIDTFAKMEPLAERNLIYSFHCYDPFFFTHQGASWVGDQPKLFKNVPFPSSPEAVNAMIDQIPEQFRPTLINYGEQRYDAAYLAARIAEGAKWRSTHHLPVLLGEFGSYPPVAPVDSRARWFAAMRVAVERYQMPNAIWGYDDALGLGRKVDNGRVVLDEVTLRSYFRQ